MDVAPDNIGANKWDFLGGTVCKGRCHGLKVIVTSLLSWRIKDGPISSIIKRQNFAFIFGGWLMSSDIWTRREEVYTAQGQWKVKLSNGSAKIWANSMFKKRGYDSKGWQFLVPGQFLRAFSSQKSLLSRAVIEKVLPNSNISNRAKLYFWGRFAVGFAQIFYQMVILFEDFRTKIPKIKQSTHQLNLPSPIYHLKFHIHKIPKRNMFWMEISPHEFPC